MQDVEQIPGSIVQAVCRVMSGIQSVKKNGHNSFGNYKFASTDDVFTEIMPRMAEAGLICLPIELEDPDIMRFDVPDKKGEVKTQQWMKVRYGFVLSTSEATWFDARNARTLMIQITGPQTFQAAASFAEKAYYRSLFKLPTGDMDLDQARQSIALQNLPDPNKKKKTSHAAKKDGTDATYKEIMSHVNAATNHETLNMLEDSYRGDIDEMPKKWVELLNDDIEAKRMSFGTPNNLNGH